MEIESTYFLHKLSKINRQNTSKKGIPWVLILRKSYISKFLQRHNYPLSRQ